MEEVRKLFGIRLSDNIKKMEAEQSKDSPDIDKIHEIADEHDKLIGECNG